MLTPDQEKLKEAALAYKRLLEAAKVYSFNYMQDEAEDEVFCVCGPKQSAEAKEVFAAIVEVESLANPAAILAILAQLEQVQGWQPIATAPKGPILLLAAEFGRPGDWRIKCGGFWEGAWEVFGASWTPTRWQNLPPPPEAA